jgi:AraC-like DNA-binding protein
LIFQSAAPGSLVGHSEGAPGRLTMPARRESEAVRCVRDFVAGALLRSDSLAEIAHDLHLSPRPLHSRLDDEGSSFCAIKYAVRWDFGGDAGLSRIDSVGLWS